MLKRFVIRITNPTNESGSVSEMDGLEKVHEKRAHVGSNIFCLIS